MTIPKKLKIGGHEIKVVLKEISDCGYYEAETGTITINKNLPKSLQESTLIHEALHVMNSTLAESREGHTLQDSLSEQMYQFLRQNNLLK